MFIHSLAVLTICLSGVAVQTQPEPAQEPSSTNPIIDSTPNPNPDAENLRKRLVQTLNFAQRIVEKHEQALSQLDQGQDPREVMRLLRTPNNTRERGGQTRMRSYMNSHPPHKPDPGSDQPPILSRKEMERVREFISEHLVNIDAQLTQIESISLEATDRLLLRLAPKILEILRLQEDNTALSSLKLDELKAGLLYVETARVYRGLLRNGSSDEEEVSEAQQCVRQAASDMFDAQVHIKQYEIHLLTMRINQLHEALSKLTAQRVTQVEAQVNAARRTPGPRFNRAANQQAPSAIPESSDD